MSIAQKIAPSSKTFYIGGKIFDNFFVTSRNLSTFSEPNQKQQTPNTIDSNFYVTNQ